MLGLSIVACLVVGVGLALETAKAAHVAIIQAGAVDELLLREADEVASGDEVGTLEGAGRAEGPTRATRSLVLDRGDGTGINPVDLRGVLGLVKLDDGGVDGAGFEAEHVLVLLTGPIRELVVSVRGGLGLVELLNHVVGGNEVDEALLEFFDGLEDLAELGDVLHVLELQVLESVGSAEGESESERLHLKILIIIIPHSSCPFI